MPKEWTEADVTINGRELTPAQVATIRVAIAGFLTELAEPGYLRDLGPIGPLYRARASEVQTLLVGDR